MIYWKCSTETSPASPNVPSTETGIRDYIVAIPVITSVCHGDWPGGPLDRCGVEVDDAEKCHCFDEMWGIKK